MPGIILLWSILLHLQDEARREGTAPAGLRGRWIEHGAWHQQVPHERWLCSRVWGALRAGEAGSARSWLCWFARSGFELVCVGAGGLGSWAGAVEAAGELVKRRWEERTDKRCCKAGGGWPLVWSNCTSAADSAEARVHWGT